MCNYAVNCIVFHSRDLALLKDLHKHISDCYKGEKLVRNLMSGYGYIGKTLNLLTNKTDWFSDCSNSIFSKGPVFYFPCETTSAWSDNITPLIVLLAEKYKNNISISFTTEEPGTDIYLIKDETGAFYSDKFKVDYCYNHNYFTEYFSKFTDLINYLVSVFPKADISPYDSISSVREEIYTNYANDEEFFLNINRFREYDPCFYQLPTTEVA